ncbi:MAG: glycosyltransferase family 2 protein [Chloroflexota bacterium]
MTLYFSVVICTYNRADWLAVALESVCTQTIDVAAYEVIVVDNNSTDNTPAVTDSFCQRYLNVRYLFESQPGNSHARNTGWKKANARYIAFIDDDCKVPSDWLMNAKTVITELSPGVFGGPYFPFFNTPKPVWFKDEYGTYQPYDCAKFLDTPDKFAAGNLFVQRQALAHIGGFNPQLGIHGTQRGYGEENALLLKIHETQPDTVFYYDPALFVYHLVRQETMSVAWMLRQRIDRGRSVYRVYNQDEPLKNKIMLVLLMARKLIQIMFRLTLGLLFRARKTYPYPQQYIYEKTVYHFFLLGWLYEQYQRNTNDEDKTV